MDSAYSASIIKHFGIDMATVNNLSLVGSDDSPNWFTGQFERQHSPLSYTQDPLALSCANYRLWKLGSNDRWRDFIDTTAEDCDVEFAEEIRRYYRDKLTIKILKGIPLTQFQKELHYVALYNPLTTKYVGMLYRLPYFYIEDTDRAKLMETFKSAPPIVASPPASRIEELTPYTKIFRSRARSEVTELWWTTDTGHPVCLPVRLDNPLRGLIEGLFDNNAPLRMRAIFFVKKQPHTDFTFWRIGGELRLV